MFHKGLNSLPREGAGFSVVLPRQRRPYGFWHLTFFNNENTPGKHKATINQLAQVGHHRRQFRAILSVVAAVADGAQVGDGLAVRNFQRFRGHAQVRGGQWVGPMTETFPLERAADACERMMSGKVRFRSVLKI